MTDQVRGLIEKEIYQVGGIPFARVVGVCFAGATAAFATLPVVATAGPANTYAEYTVRTVNGSFTADAGSASTTSPMSGGEPSVAFDSARNAAMYGSGLKVKRLTFDSQSPAVMTVTDVTPTTATVASLDAITAVDPYTNRTFSTELAGACSFASFSDDAGASWTPAAPCGPLLDHQTIGGGPFHSPAPSPPNPLYNDATYYCAQNGYLEDCALSVDGGINYTTGVPIQNTPANDPTDPNPTVAANGGQCSALTGHVRVGPNGTAYVPLKGRGGTFTTQEGTNTEWQGGTPALTATENNGALWTIRKVPAVQVPDGLGGMNTVENPDESDPSVGISQPGGVLYYRWENGHNPPDQTGVPPVNGTTTQAMIGVSHDNGLTWTHITDLSSVLGVRNVQFPEV